MSITLISILIIFLVIFIVGLWFIYCFVKKRFKGKLSIKAVLSKIFQIEITLESQNKVNNKKSLKKDKV